MNLVADAMSGIGAALLPIAAALLFEELTFGGLVRLLLTPWPGTRRQRRRAQDVLRTDTNTGSANGKRGARK